MLHDQAWPGFDEAKETIVITQLGVIGGQLFPTEQRNIVKLLIEKVLQAAASSVRDVGLQSSNNRGISLREKNLIKIVHVLFGNAQAMISSTTRTNRNSSIIK